MSFLFDKSKEKINCNKQEEKLLLEIKLQPTFYFVQNYVPENLDSVAEFEGPPSPDCTYTQAIPSEEDFAKEPLVLPPQLHLSVVGVEEKSEEASSCLSSSKPQHVMLNHVFIEKGWASQSVVALGLTHRYESKYVTVVLYKPLKR